MGRGVKVCWGVMCLRGSRTELAPLASASSTEVEINTIWVLAFLAHIFCFEMC